MIQHSFPTRRSSDPDTAADEEGRGRAIPHEPPPYGAPYLEGIAFGPELPDGDRTLVLVSDDNFQPFQQTQIIALRLHSATRGGS